MSAAYTLTHEARPPLMNAWGRMHREVRRKTDAEWRGVFHKLALEAKVPALECVTVEVGHEYSGQGRPPDVAAACPAAKAGIDGLVDAGVLPEDGPRFVRSVTFTTPVRSKRNALTLTIRETPRCDQCGKPDDNLHLPTIDGAETALCVGCCEAAGTCHHETEDQP